MVRHHEKREAKSFSFPLHVSSFLCCAYVLLLNRLNYYANAHNNNSRKTTEERKKVNKNLGDTDIKGKEEKKVKKKTR